MIRVAMTLGVQTSIYIFKAGYPHDVRNKVKFIDFSDDRYKDVIDVYKYGDDTKNIDFIEDIITLNGNDWNYDQHRVIDTTPTEEDFLKTV